LDALNGVEASDLADIPGLAEHAESVLAAAHAEKVRRSGADTNPLINNAPPEEAPPEPEAETLEPEPAEPEAAEEATAQPKEAE